MKEEGLHNVNVKVRNTCTLEMGALRIGQDDDLVKALGLASIIDRTGECLE